MHVHPSATAKPFDPAYTLQRPHPGLPDPLHLHMLMQQSGRRTHGHQLDMTSDQGFQYAVQRSFSTAPETLCGSMTRMCESRAGGKHSLTT